MIQSAFAHACVAQGLAGLMGLHLAPGAYGYWNEPGRGVDLRTVGVGASQPREGGCWPERPPTSVCRGAPLSATLRPLLAPGRRLSGLGAATLGCRQLEAPGS